MLANSSVNETLKQWHFS